MKAQIRSVQSIYASEWTTIINIKKRWPRPTATRGESAWMNKKAHRTHTHKAIASSCLELPQRWRSISNGIILAADKKKKKQPSCKQREAYEEWGKIVINCGVEPANFIICARFRCRAAEYARPTMTAIRPPARCDDDTKAAVYGKRDKLRSIIDAIVTRLILRTPAPYKAPLRGYVYSYISLISLDLSTKNTTRNVR